MEKIREFIVKNPQVSAAIITAACGILGIFINIAINVCFRNHDYKNKNRMKQIENMELYYLPLRDKIEHFIEFMKIISKNGETNLYHVLDGKMGASCAREVKLFEKSLEKLHEHFNSGLYKIVDDYKLFKSHRKVRIEVWELYQYSQKKVNTSNASNNLNLNDYLEELEELIYRIQLYEAKVMVNNFFCRVLELFSIWMNNKIKK